MMKRKLKQVILMRRDLNMMPGKAAAQASHAGMLFMVKRFHFMNVNPDPSFPHEHFSEAENDWMFYETMNIRGWEYGGLRTVVLGVENLFALKRLGNKAIAHGLEYEEVYDEGMEAITCGAIGPDYDDSIDLLTGGLDLY